MTLKPAAALRLVAAGLLTVYRRRLRRSCRTAHHHALALVEAVDQPWLYRHATDS